jgi:hypothetical protein
MIGRQFLEKLNDPNAADQWAATVYNRAFDLGSGKYNRSTISPDCRCGMDTE